MYRQKHESPLYSIPANLTTHQNFSIIQQSRYPDLMSKVIPSRPFSRSQIIYYITACLQDKDNAPKKIHDGRSND